MPELPEPTRCHFWKLDNPNPQRGETEVVKSFEDDSHFVAKAGHTAVVASLRLGNIAPDLWMKHATGSPVGPASTKSWYASPVMTILSKR